MSFEEFVRLRRELSGDDLPLDALRVLMEEEPDLASGLRARIFPSVLRHAQVLAERGEPSLHVHGVGVPGRTILSRSEVAGWVAHMFLGTLPDPPAGFPHIDFAPLLSAPWPQETAKLRCVLAYFNRIAEAPPRGQIEIERIVVAPRGTAEWATNPSSLTPLEVDRDGVIEDAVRHRQVDFANKALGGGVLSGGCVQEEIRFAIAPELLAGMIVSPRMREDEAIVLRGSERFARTSGYAQSLRYAGPFKDLDAAGGGVELVAIDAVDYRRQDRALQFTRPAIVRELGKARSGFLRDAASLPVATGNWGCGAFYGDPPLKAVIQWLAASAEGRAVRYFPFGDERVGDLLGFAKTARTRFHTVGALFGHLLSACGEGGAGLYRRLLFA